MALGTSTFLMALGAILKFAVDDRIDGIELGTIGVILMIVGGIGLLASLLWANSFNRRDPVATGDDVVVERRRRYVG